MCKHKSFHVLMALLIFCLVGTVSAVSIPDSAGTVVMQDGPNNEGLFFNVNVHFEAFDGQDASDPLGITPGKNQFAYILEYVDGNERTNRYEVESLNGVAIDTVGTSTTGTVNGVAPGTIAPLFSGIITFPTGNPGARYITRLDTPGTKSVILVYTAGNDAQIGDALGIVTDSSLSAVGDVVGPVDCTGTISGNVICTRCEPTGDVEPVEGVTVKVLAGGVEVVATTTDKNGQYQIPEIDPGDYTVAIEPGTDMEACAKTSVDVSVTCEEGGYASFCVCPICEQELCVQVACAATGEPIAKTWVGICGPDGLLLWRYTDENGMVCLSGAKIVPGSYKIKIKPKCHYQANGPTMQTVELLSCEKKTVTFDVCPPPPCEPQVCVNVIAVDQNGQEYAIEGVQIKLAKVGRCLSGVTGVDGTACFTDLKAGHYIASLKMPQGYRRCSGEEKCVRFRLDRCEQRDIQFVLCELQSFVCPEKPDFWANNVAQWPVDTLELGGVTYTQQELLNILDGKTPSGDSAKRDMSVQMAKYLIATKLSVLDGADPTDIESVIAAADQFLTHNAPGSKPGGRARKCARDIKNSLHKYLCDRSACEGANDTEGNGTDEDDSDGDDGAAGGGVDDSDL